MLEIRFFALGAQDLRLLALGVRRAGVPAFRPARRPIPFSISRRLGNFLRLSSLPATDLESYRCGIRPGTTLKSYRCKRIGGRPPSPRTHRAISAPRS